MWASLDARGRIRHTGEREGAGSQMEGTVVVVRLCVHVFFYRVKKCIGEDSEAFYFQLSVLDLFVNEEDLSAKYSSDDSTQYSSFDTQYGTKVVEEGFPIGDNLYYQQNRTGEIPAVWYNKNDLAYYTNIKLAVVNALQTRLVPEGTLASAFESDCVGKHFSQFKASSDSSTMFKYYTQNDFESFPDPNLFSENINILGLGTATINPAGYISSASLEETVTLVNVAPAIMSDLPIGWDLDITSMSEEDSTPEIIPDIDLVTKGALILTLTSTAKSSSVLPASQSLHRYLLNSPFEHGSLFGAARATQQYQEQPEDIEAMLSEYLNAAEEKILLGDFLVRYFRVCVNKLWSY